MKQIKGQEYTMRRLGNTFYIIGVAMLIASLLTSLIPPTEVKACHPIVSGSASCQADYTYLVSWTISNSESGNDMTITSINRSIGISPGTVVSSSVQGSESLPGSQSGTITLKVSSSWSNGATGSNSGSVKLDGKCIPPPTKTPVTPSPTPSNTPETPTNTSTQTYTPETPSQTPTNTPTDTPTNTPTDTSTPTITPTDTPTNTPTDTSTPTITFSPTSTSTGTVTETYTPSITPTNTPTNTFTSTPTQTDTPEPPTATPTITATFHDPFSLEFYCTGFTVINRNNFEASYEWNIAGGPSGTGVVGPYGTDSYDTDYYPGVVTLYSGGVLMAAGYLPTDCDKDKKTPTPPVRTPRTPAPSQTPHDPTKVIKTLIPPITRTPDILIPVTGVDLGGGNSLQRMLFSLGLGFLGLGFVMNGLSRRRRDLDI